VTLTQLFLGIIAAATLVMAVLQVGAILYAGVLLRRVARLLGQVEQELKPFSESVNAIGRDAARAAALAAAQVERVDRLFASVTDRVEQTVQALQKAAGMPAREGAALIVALKAAVGAFRELRERSRTRVGRTEDEDALFIG
jgi:broad specificity phosphatase PhoE